MQRCHAYTVVSLTPIVWSRHTTPSILHWRESVLHGKRPNNSCKRDYAYCCFSTKKNIKIICLKLVALKISFYVILLWKANWDCWTMLLLYIIKCRLFTRKWHKMEQSLMWQNGIWWVEYNSSMWNIAYCSCRAMIGHVVIRFWMFSWYMFTMCIVSKGAEKTHFNLKNDAES